MQKKKISLNTQEGIQKTECAAANICLQCRAIKEQKICLSNILEMNEITRQSICLHSHCLLETVAMQWDE